MSNHTWLYHRYKSIMWDDVWQCLESLRLRLGPLRRAQLDLEKHLGLAEGEEMCTTSVPELVKATAAAQSWSGGGGKVDYHVS